MVSYLTAREQWDLTIPEMSYTALLANLPAFDAAGITPYTFTRVAARIADPAQVTAARIMPCRLHTAWETAPARWQRPLECALHHSTLNTPAVPGRTLILIDTSGSMTPVLDKAVLFAVTTAQRNPGTDICGFATDWFGYIPDPGKGLVTRIREFTAQAGTAGHGSMIGRAVRDCYDAHDRVVIFTDTDASDPDQTWPVPPGRHVHLVNAAAPPAPVTHAGPWRHRLAGITDHMFTVIPQLEAAAAGRWPWQP